MKNNLNNIKSDNINKIDWKLLQNEMKNKFGSEIYDSWLKKIDLVDEFKNYVLLSVSTRFIRDWITSRYLDQILQIIKLYKKDISRIEFVINENIKIKNNNELKQDNSSENEKVSFIFKFCSSLELFLYARFFLSSTRNSILMISFLKLLTICNI